ncbi:MAG: TonB-dependent receptor [Bacteroidia bacterium]
MKRGNRLFLLIIFLLGCQFLAAQASLRIYETFKNQPLTQVLNHLGKKYDYIFAYDAARVKNVYITASLKGVNMEEAIQTILQHTNLEYLFIKNRQIVIRPRKEILLPQNTRSVSRETSPSRSMYFSGRVLDHDTRQPLPFAYVYLSPDYGSYTDSLGYFRLLMRGTQDSVKIRYIGYRPRVLAVDISILSQPAEILLHSEILNLDEVLISEDNRYTATTGGTVGKISLNPDKISTLSSLGEPDILRTLQLLPGISSNQESASGLNIRGGSADQNLILFDGITIYQPGHFFGTFSAFNTRATKDVQVFRGGFRAKYGGRSSAVLDITGKPGDPDKLSFGAGINLMNANAYVETPVLKGKGALLLAGRRSFSDIVQSVMYKNLFDNIFQQGVIYNDKVDALDSGRNITLDPSFFFEDLNGKFTFHASEKDLLSLTAYQGRDVLAYNSSDLSDPDFVIHTEDTLELRNRGLSFNWARQWNPGFYSKTTAAISYFDQKHIYNYLYRQENEPGIVHRFPQENALRQYDLQNENEWRINARNTLSLGWAYSFLNVSYRFRWMENESVLLDDKLNKQGSIIAGFAERNWTPGDKFSLQTGLRYSYFTPTAKIYWEPRTSLSYQVSDKLKLKAAWSLHNQFMSSILQFNALSVGEDFWALADGDTVPVVHSSHLIAGFEREVGGFLIDVELYYKKSRGLVTYEYSLSPGTLEINQVNLVGNGSSLAKGIDIMVQKKWGNYTGWISYSLGRVIQRFPGIEAGKAFPAPYDHLHKLNSVNTYSVRNWELSLNWTLASGKPYTDLVERYVTRQSSEELEVDLGARNAARLPAYHRLDFSATYSLLPKDKNSDLKVGISIFNLYNRKNVRDFRYSVVTDAKRKQPELISMNRNLLGFSPNLFISLDF